MNGKLDRFKQSEGRATVTPRDESIATSTALTVNQLRGLYSSYHRRIRRSAVMSAARVHESARRRQVSLALEALDSFLAPSPIIDRKARTVMEALETRYTALRSERLEVESAMRHEALDGRPASLAPRILANASEVRHSRRWQSTPRTALESMTRGDGSPFVSPFERTSDGKGRKGRKALDPRKARTARLRSAAGTIVMGQQD